MLYGKAIVRDCNDAYVTGRHREFIQILSLAIKKACLEKSIPRQRLSCLYDLFIFCVMLSVTIKLSDMKRLCNTFLQKTKCFVFEIQVKNLMRTN